MENPQIRFRIVRCRRKTVGIHIDGPGLVTVRAPLRMPESEILRLVRSKQSWIEKHMGAVRTLDAEPKLSEEEIKELARLAREVIPPLVQKWAVKVGVKYGRVTIRSQRTRWGSCSSAGNLNFNCLLVRCPARVMDYVIVHELCHRKELNHSPRFWAEVERVLPDYRLALRWLKADGEALIAGLR